MSAAGFGAALFGRRPIPQAATIGSGDPGDGAATAVTAETLPSLLRAGQATAVRVTGGRGPIILQPPPAPTHLTGRDVRSPIHVRLRSAVVLLLGTVGTAVLVGAIASIVIVGALLLIS